MKTLEVFITDEGEVQCLAPDDIDVTELGRANVRRASHVEFSNERGCWTATLPCGTEIGSARTRGEALALEVAYLNERIADDTIEEVF